jgi:hypothetical protein
MERSIGHKQELAVMVDTLEPYGNEEAMGIDDGHT